MNTVFANGRPFQIQFPCNLVQLLQTLNLPNRNVVVEHNGEAVSPSQFPQREISPGDRLEIVQIAAGG